MAVSTRTSAADANAFTLARMMVPTAPMPIDERFRLIQAIADEARGGSGGASLQTLAAVAAALPTSLVTRLARQQAQTIDFATSNVKAAPMPVYIAGAQLLENYPLGPLAGVAFNLTLLSYNGSLDMGINIDAAAVAEPALLAKHLDARVRRPPRRRDAFGGRQTCSGSGVGVVRAERTSRRTSATSLADTSSRLNIWPSAWSMTASASAITASCESCCGRSSCSVIPVHGT